MIRPNWPGRLRSVAALVYDFAELRTAQISKVPDWSEQLEHAMATFTGAIGTGSKWLLDKIVGALAATGVNPNFLTFLGLGGEFHRRG